MAYYGEIYKKLKQVLTNRRNDSLKNLIGTEADFTVLMNNIDVAGNNVENMGSDKEKTLYNNLKKFMIENQTAAAELKTYLPDIYKQQTEHLKKLRREATTFARSDMKKKEANQINARRKQARKELEEIRKARVKNDARAKGVDPTKEQMKAPTLHENTLTTGAKTKNIFTNAFNEDALGTKAERTGLDKDNNVDPSKRYPKKETRNYKPITHIIKGENGGIKLTGAKFIPDRPKDPEKVALVFSGSRGTGAEYINSIKDAYLAQGITVVQLDYRGFGTSTNIDGEGKSAENIMTETSMYEDGMEMYKYVNETMGIDPENITLHGYSLGGAIASRVALEVTKNIQNEQAMLNEKYDPTKGLGGVVLHSPIKNMYEAALATSNSFFAQGGWWFGGHYNTEQHMLDLAKIDKNIPVHMIGGTTQTFEDEVEKINQGYGDPDWLSPEKTGLKASIEGKFTNCTYFQGKGDHAGKKTGLLRNENGALILDNEGLAQRTEENEPNVSALDQGLRRIVGKGRSLNNDLKRQMELQQGGPAVGEPLV